MTEIDSRFVHRGFWINVEQGPVMGRTITTDIQTGTVVVALLAILASLATSHVWNLITFLCHQLRADGLPADGLFRQQQALLRTLPTPSSLLADWVKLWWAWRTKTQRAFVRSFAHFILALMFVAATIAVGVFSSYIVSSTNLEVLVSSPLCRPLDVTPSSSNFVDNVDKLTNYQRKVSSLSAPFAQECYRNETAIPARCRAFIRPNVPLKHEQVRCPFASSICLGDEYGVSVDSGLVDMNDGFGLNMLSRDRVKYRRKTTCGVLRTEGHSWTVNASTYPFRSRPLLPEEEMLVSFYGRQLNAGAWGNVTFALSLVLANVSRVYGPNGLTGSYIHPDWEAFTELDPLREMKSDDADLVLVMIPKNQMKYETPVNDPVFAAHKPFVYRLPSSTASTTNYLSDWPISTLGCKEQYQLCFARASAPDFCTNLTGLPGEIIPKDYPGASDVQLAALQLLVTAGFLFDVSDAAMEDLQASYLAGTTGVITSLPDDQWVREVVAWEKDVWAALQITVADYALGYETQDSSAQDATKNVTTLGEKQLCQSQRMRKSGGFVNINVFALTLIITFACVMSILDILLLRFLIFLTRFRHTLAPQIDRWIQDGVFQLQRRAYEANEGGSWKDIDQEIPVTMSSEYLAELPLESLSNQHSVCVCIKEKSAAETSIVDSKSGCTYANSTKVEHVENVSPLKERSHDGETESQGHRPGGLQEPK